jgi:hypothetical protein
LTREKGLQEQNDRYRDDGELYQSIHDDQALGIEAIRAVILSIGRRH